MGCNSTLLGSEQILCTKCLSDLPRTTHVNSPDDNPVFNKLHGRIKLKHAFALLNFTKGGIVQQALHKLKYHGRKDIGVRFGEVLAESMVTSKLGQEYDLIISLPLHKLRQHKRGYNQSTCFAEGLSKGLGIPFAEHIVKRNVATSTQTSKTRIKRWENVETVFKLADPKAVQNKNVLLVDDVITTGATIEACAQVLLHDVKSLSVAFIATV